MSVHAIRHPLVQHKLGLMREAGISTKSFRELAGELAKLLTYEATQDLELEEQEIPGWSGKPIPVKLLKGKKVTIVPILRAGLGMLDGVTDLIPSARISVVGLYRDEETLEPVPISPSSRMTWTSAWPSSSTRCWRPVAPWLPPWTCCASAAASR